MSSQQTGSASRYTLPEAEIPFTVDEFRSRLLRIRAEMERRKIDLLFLSAPESLYYASGYRAEWYQAQSPKIWPPASGIAISVDAEDPIHFEAEMEEVLVQFTTVSRDIRIYRGDAPSMIDFIVGELKAEGWLRGTVGLEIFSYRPNRGHSEQFEAALRTGGVSITDATDILREIRRIKSPQELAYLRTAGRLADIGMDAARRALSIGATELDVHAEMTYAMLKAGGEPAAIPLLVIAGTKTAAPHALASRRRIMPGDPVMIDVCGVYNRYHSNVARTFSLGEPRESTATRVEKAAHIFSLLPDILEPGMRVSELTAFVRSYYEEAGIWNDRWWVGGYELGIAFAPDWDGPFTYDAGIDPGDAIFEPGMVVNYESDFFLPEGVGASIVINTLEFGAENVSYLSSFPPELAVIE